MRTPRLQRSRHLSLEIKPASSVQNVLPVVYSNSIVQRFAIARTACARPTTNGNCPVFDPMLHRLYTNHRSGPSTRTVRIEPVRVRDLQILLRACAGGGQRRSALRASEQKDMCVTVRYVLHLASPFCGHGLENLPTQNDTKTSADDYHLRGPAFPSPEHPRPERKHWLGGVPNAVDGTIQGSYVYRKHLSFFSIPWPTLSIR
jgi:hypothetical protein